MTPFKTSSFLFPVSDTYASALYKRAVTLLIMMHIAGLIGLNWSVTQPLFVLLVPFNLLVTMVLVLLFHPSFSISFLFFCLICFLSGFLVELWGVRTGMVFGIYQYGTALGWKLWEVPLVIGCNWLTLIYCTGIIAHMYIKRNWLRPVLASVLMVVIDILIEPVAIQLDFWSWHQQAIPIQNYAGWFVTSLILQVAFQYLVKNRENAMAPMVYIIQFAFFLGCNLILWLS